MRVNVDWMEPLKARQSLDRAIVADRINKGEHAALRAGALLASVLLLTGAAGLASNPIWFDALCWTLALVSFTLPGALLVRVGFWMRWRLQDDEGYGGGL